MHYTERGDFYTDSLLLFKLFLIIKIIYYNVKSREYLL